MLGAPSIVQVRDNAGFIINDFNARPFNNSSTLNQYFTLTQSDVTTVTVPNSPATKYTAYFTYTIGADVWVLPAGSPTLTAPDGTVTATLAELLPAVRTVLPGQTLQFLYENTVFAESTVSVSITYFANNNTNNSMQG